MTSNETKIVVLNGKSFDRTMTHFGLDADLGDMDELKKLAEFNNLISASFAGTNLDDIGLDHVCKVTSIEDLNLQWTDISDEGLRSLAKLPRLATLRLKENDQLTNACTPHLRKLANLTDLQIHGTSIDQRGLQELICLKNLRDLCIEPENCGNVFEAANALSLLMPACTILVKGRGQFHNGMFTGKW